MSVTARALFVIERNLAAELTLDEVAARCNVSLFHLSHAFGETTGMSVGAYIRRRRLTEAARRLAQGEASILAVAADSGYGSHEAFTRAFKAQFGVTPDAMRKTAATSGPEFQDAIAAGASAASGPGAPRIVDEESLLFVGSSEHIRFDRRQDIAGHWARFMTDRFDAIEHTDGSAPVGVVSQSAEDGIDYMCAVSVRTVGLPPKGCTTLRVDTARYAVFTHARHVAHIGDTYRAIWDEWLPASDFAPMNAPSLERHKESFDPGTGLGGVDLWIPVIARSGSR